MLTWSTNAESLSILVGLNKYLKPVGEHLARKLPMALSSGMMSFRAGAVAWHRFTSLEHKTHSSALTQFPPVRYGSSSSYHLLSKACVAAIAVKDCIVGTGLSEKAEALFI